jgi:hypothetical protein
MTHPNGNPPNRCDVHRNAKKCVLETYSCDTGRLEDSGEFHNNNQAMTTRARCTFKQDYTGKSFDTQNKWENFGRLPIPPNRCPVSGNKPMEMVHNGGEIQPRLTFL